MVKRNAMKFGGNMEDIPYIGFDNRQLENAIKIEEGDFATCPRCKTLVKVKNSDPPALQFISHCEKDWLVGINGKYVQNIRPACSGKIDMDITKS